MRVARLLPFLLIGGPVFAYFPGEPDFNEPLEVVAFGSCNRDELPQPLWPAIASQQPDLWIWAGDNIYADWYEGDEQRGERGPVEWMQARYDAQFSRPDYAVFRSAFPVLGTWDDHDYGKNNAGAGFPLKAEAATLALDFLEVPNEDPRRSREGIYGSYTFGPKGKQAKVLLIDDRYFAGDDGLLGAAQREWLALELTDSAAELHLIVSGIQVLSEEHRWEKWANFPEDRQWLFDLIVEQQVPGVIFLSGDRHIHELSMLELEGLSYPLIDLTSSGLTHVWESFKGEPNRHRIGEVVKDLGYGLLRIDWESQPVEVTFEIRTGEKTPALKLTQTYP